MQSDNQKLITAARQLLMRQQIRERQEAAREIAAEGQLRADLELFFDDLKAEGIEPRGQLGIFITGIWLARRLRAAGSLEVENW